MSRRARTICSPAMVLAAAAAIAAAFPIAAPAAAQTAAPAAQTGTDAPLRHELLDDFRDPSAWEASASDQVKAALRRDASDGSLCLDYDFAGVSGYAVMQRDLPLDWPGRFDLQLRVKGTGGANDVQLKFVDASGDNVWWVPRPNQALPAALTDWTLRQRHLSFAWGPTADRTLRRTASVEFVVAAGRDGGKGSLCVARLALAERVPDPPHWPEPTVRSRGAMTDIDFGLRREFNGVALRWPATASARDRGLDYELLASDDGRHWRRLRRVTGSDGGLDALFLPDSEARRLRIRVDAPPSERPRTRGPAARPQVELREPSQWPDFNAVLAELAHDAPPGQLPRAFLGEQNYWSLVGVDGGGERSALLSEDGAIELGRGGFSIEPAVRLDAQAGAEAQTVTWKAAAVSQSLPDGYLPLPAVHWQHEAFTLDIEAAADGPRDAPQALARYTLTNVGTKPRRFTLLLALRPWQVNPPQQFLTTPGGARPVRELVWSDGVLAVDGRPALRPSQAPSAVSGLPFDGGASLEALAAAPPLGHLADPQAHASALLRFELTLQPGERRRIAWTAPLAAGGSVSDTADVDRVDAAFLRAATRWRERLNRVTFSVPHDAQPLADSLRSALAQILISRDGPALRPGTRSYARTWVRDGAMMAVALLRLGEVDGAREFVDWYAPFVFDSGKVPCCVDARGADPVAENDSHGEYLYAVAEVWRHTRDRAFLEHHWPTVQRVVAYQEQLRQSERGQKNREPGREALFGLMPPSISHEGYSDKPAYAYWDNFWALRGYKDAVQIARAIGSVGADEAAARWAGWADEFERELGASIPAAMRHHGIAFIPGAADRGDFDATSTTIAFDPVEATLPGPAVEATFERYWQAALARSEGRLAWKDYTPYEWRTVGTLARLGAAGRAHAMLDYFMRDRRPSAWNQWAEVVRPGYRERGFIGDLPHAWVASDFIRSALDLFAYVREADASIVVGAGWKPEWLAEGLALSGLSTAYGPFGYRLEPEAGGWRFTLASTLPGAQGGVHLHWPGSGPLPRATLDGRELAWAGRRLALPATPLTLHLAGP